MTLVIDPNLVSYTLIKNKILTYVKNKPDGEAWKDFYDSGTGILLIDLLAGTSAFLTYNAITSRRETYLNYVRNRSSAIGIAENLSYNVSRGRNAHVQLVVVSTEIVTINKWDVIGTVNDFQVVAWQTIILYPSQPTILEVAIGNIVTDITYDVNTSSTDVFRIVANKVSDDVRLLYRKSTSNSYVDLDKENAMSTSLIDLLEDKYVLLTNPYDSVDIYYLNNKPSILNVGDEVRFITSGTLPSPLLQNTAYYVIPRGANLISLASVEINAYNNIPIDIMAVGNGLHLINSTYSFNLDGYSVDNINPVGLTNNTIAVDGIFPKYQYANGTTLRLDYIELSDVVFNLTDIELFSSTIQLGDSRTKVLNTYTPPESISNIKANAPLFFETQFVIKGREDFRKVLKRLDTTFIGTNGRDLSPAVVEVTYLKEDLSNVTKEQKLNLKTKLNSNRPFGIAPAQISDPQRVNYKLKVSLLLYVGVTVPPLEQELQNVLTFEPVNNGIINLRERRFEYTLNTYQLEHEIDHLINSDGQRYIQIARVSIDSSAYSTNTVYKRGDFVTDVSNTSGMMFECVRVVGKNFIDFTTNFSDIINPTYINTTLPHGLITGQAVKVLRTGLDRLPNPLSESTVYYVKYRGTSIVSLSLTPDGEDVYFLNNGGGMSGGNNIISGMIFSTNYLLNPTHITITAHGLQNNETVEVYSDKVLPNPLVEGITYYVNVVDANNIELKTLIPATDLLPATYSDPIALTDNGAVGATNTLHTAIGQGYSGLTTPVDFSTALTEGVEIIDNEVIWKSVSKTRTEFKIGWNEYFMFDFTYQTTL